MWAVGIIVLSIMMKCEHVFADSGKLDDATALEQIACVFGSEHVTGVAAKLGVFGCRRKLKQLYNHINKNV